MRNISAGLTVLLGVFFFTALPADAQDNVQARGWSKATYGRIIFDWPKPVQHSARVEGGALLVEFSRPMSGDLDRVVKYLGDYVTSADLSDSGKVARFGLAGNFDVNSFATGASVVVDLRRSTTAAAPLRPSTAAGGGLRVNVGRHPGFTRLVFDWPDSVNYTVARKGRSVAMRFDRAADLNISELDAALPKPAFGSPSASNAGGGLVLNLVVPGTSYIRHFVEGSKVVLDVQEEGGDFGNMMAGSTSGTMMQTISPTGEVLVVPAMVGSHVAVSSDNNIPLITEDGDGFHQRDQGAGVFRAQRGCLTGKFSSESTMDCTGSPGLPLQVRLLCR